MDCVNGEERWFFRFRELAREEWLRCVAKGLMDVGRWDVIANLSRRWRDVENLVARSNESYFRERVDSVRLKALRELGLEDTRCWTVLGEDTHYVCSPADCGHYRQYCASGLGRVTTRLLRLWI